MDTGTLVENRIDHGKNLIESLARRNFNVTAACWIKPSEDERWFLYIASQAVDEKGLAQSYRDVYGIIQKMEDPLISMSEVKLISPSHPIARDVLMLQSRTPSRIPTRYNGSQLGRIAIEEAYIYPQRPAPLQAHLWEQRKLKKDVKQMDRPEDFLLTHEEKAVVNQLLTQGFSRQEAEEWIRKKREAMHPRPPIPAGTTVKTYVTAWWGERPEDDPNPLLMVEAPDGARGLTLKSDTETI